MSKPIIGIVAEFDPFHWGHAHLIRQARAALPGATVVIAMSGRFTQRGGAACLTPQARGEMALRCGADLVLELPLPFAISSAQRFAAGGIAVLRCAGVTDLFCGSESGDALRLTRCAAALRHPRYPDLLRRHLATGIAFAAARQRAVSELTDPDTGGVLARPNDLLAVSYLEAMGDQPMTLHPVPRLGPDHNAPQADRGRASAAALRALLLAGDVDRAAGLMPPAAAEVLRRELALGRGPASLAHAERAVLYRLRQMTADDFAALPDCSEGLEHRLVRCARRAVSLEDFYERCRSRRCPRARVQRLALRAFLGLPETDLPLPYLQVLALGQRGREVLRSIRSLPVITAPAGAKALSGPAAEALHRASKAADLWELCLPAPGPCGAVWTANPYISLST